VQRGTWEGDRLRLAPEWRSLPGRSGMQSGADAPADVTAQRRGTIMLTMPLVLAVLANSSDATAEFNIGSRRCRPLAAYTAHGRTASRRSKVHGFMLNHAFV
jgi:hypothetical protein